MEKERTTTEFENPITVETSTKKEKKGIKMKKLTKIVLGTIGATVLTAVGYKVGHKIGHRKGFCLGAWAQAVADRVAPGMEGAVQEETGITVSKMQEFGNQAQSHLTERGYGRWFNK